MARIFLSGNLHQFGAKYAVHLLVILRQAVQMFLYRLHITPLNRPGQRCGTVMLQYIFDIQTHQFFCSVSRFFPGKSTAFQQAVTGIQYGDYLIAQNACCRMVVWLACAFDLADGVAKTAEQLCYSLYRGFLSLDCKKGML